jgi:hypothetical protein
VDLTGDAYGDLGSNMYAVVWTYYGNDSTYTKSLQSYGTKFAADNWMHKSMGIQLGLTDSLRCQLPKGTDGTGYWTITVCAMGYEDYTVQFVATADNIVASEEDEEVDTSELDALVKQGQTLNESDYTADSWKDLSTELSESVEMLQSDTITQAMVDEQVKHLTDAINNLVKSESDNKESGDDSQTGNNPSDDSQTGSDNSNDNLTDGDASNNDETDNDTSNDQLGDDTSDTDKTDNIVATDNSQNANDNSQSEDNNNQSDDSNTAGDSASNQNSSSASTDNTVNTGDESHVILWLSAMVLSGLGIAAVAKLRKKER